MRIAEFTLERYGPFDELRLSLATEPGQITLLFAPNGFGKSVIRRALGDLLFDFPHHSPMAFRFAAPQMRLHARLLAEDGTARTVIRRKGRGNTLTDGAETPVPLEDLRRLIGNADRPLFEQLFALDTELLRAGGKELLEAEGRLGRALFVAGGGLGAARLLAEIEQQRDKFGRPERRVKSQPIWQAAEALTRSQRELTGSAMRPEAWDALNDAADAAQKRLTTLREEASQVNASLAALSRRRAVRPCLAQRAAALLRLGPLSGVPRLEPEFERRWRSALEARTRAQSDAKAVERVVAERRHALAALPPPDPVLTVAGEIEALTQRVTSLRNAEADLPRVLAEHDRVAALVDLRRRDLGWDTSVPLPPAAVVRDAQLRLRRLASATSARDHAMRLHADAARRLENARKTVEALPPIQDLSAVTALVDELRARGEPLRRLEASRMAVRQTAAGLEAALSAIPGVPPMADLRSTIAPAEAELAAAEAGLSSAEAAVRDSRRECDRLKREIAKVQTELAALSRGADLPSPEALRDARAHRDRLWLLVHRSAFGGSAPTSDELAALGGMPLPVAFDRALHAADAIADGLLAHGAETARAEALRQSLDALGKGCAAAEAESETASAALDAARSRIVEIAKAAGARNLDTPAALRPLLRARFHALERASAHERAVAEAAEVQDHLTTLSARLAIALGRPGGGPEDLPELIAEADKRRAVDSDLRARLEEATRTLREATSEVADREAEASRAQADHASAEQSWRDAARNLCRPEGESPEQAETVLGLIEELRNAEEKLIEFRLRVRQMREEIDGFRNAVSDISARVAPELTSLPPHEAERQLAARLTRAIEADNTARRLNADLTTEEKRATAEARVADEAQREVAVMCAALGVMEESEAEAQLGRVRDRAAAEQALNAAETSIALHGGGLPIEELERLVAVSSHEADEIEHARLIARQEELAPLVEQAAADSRSAAEQRDRAIAETTAADAAARREVARAALAHATEDALLLHAAASLLRAGLDRQRATGESRLLNRIGETFRTLTCGDYCGVAVEGDREQTLVALEKDNGRKQLAELSEGTRDQLYLALRLVALEEYAAVEPPLPFVADDVLQTFDDRRTQAALRSLVDLSHYVQVIGLTHHAHVAELALALPDDAVRTIVLPEMVPALYAAG